MSSQLGWLRSVLALLALAGMARAEGAAFDLPGPRVEVKVTRAGKTLPISQVPNLQAGDRLWVHPVLPATQSVRYLLVGAFLRGTTNPPPDDWFIKAETWTKDVREEGISITVPQDSQQVLLFLAPQTGGDFSTLRSTVRGKPGAFVRASQDLNQASLDRSRLDKYLSIVKKTSETDPDALHDRSLLLARSLNIKLDQQCFDKPSVQQAPCLMQNTEQLVLDDGHSQSMVDALTSGPNSDLIGQLSSTKLGGGGAYSPYIGAFVDVARIMSNIHTAEYQYIPALALPKQDHLNLKLNNPPSFRKPKSVLVIGLPAVEAVQLPPLRAVDPNQVFCLQRSSLVLPVEGAPLIFSGDLAHDFTLHVQSKSGRSVDLPAVADAGLGGFVVDTHAMRAGDLDVEVSGTLNGYWGFQRFEGPAFHLCNAHPAKWTIPASGASTLIVGRDDVLRLQSDTSACVAQVTVKDPQGKALKASWKAIKPGELEVQVPLKDAAPGLVTVSVKQHGLPAPDEISVQAYSEASHLDQFIISAGDQQGVLRGTRLDQVASISLNGIHFVPAGLSRTGEKDELRLIASDPAAATALRTREKVGAQASLKDQRVLEVQASVEAPRPKVEIISKRVEAGETSPASAVHLASPDDLPQDGRLSFVLKTQIPATFPRSEKIEVASADDSFRVFLSLADGNLILQDPQTVLAVLNPLKSFGPSAFGPLRFRPVDHDLSGDWQPLATLVRVPSLKDVRCPDSPDKQCTLSGTNLFLIDSIASDAQFTRPAPVPPGFVNSGLSVPRPNGTLLYLKLRDDPAFINVVALPVFPESR
jgi:hypothetical protein